MKPVGGGILGVGFVAFGLALSCGVISIGLNAVGWIAIGMNAVGFVAIGAINAVGVISVGGVNGLGGWGVAGVNAGFSQEVGISFTALALAVVTILRIRSWPRRDRAGFVPLTNAPDEERGWALARVVSLVGSAIDLQDPSTTLRVVVTPQLAMSMKAPARGALARVRLKRAIQQNDASGYREEGGAQVVELVEIVVEREGFWRKMFGDAIGMQLACAILSTFGTIAALVLNP